MLHLGLNLRGGEVSMSNILWDIEQPTSTIDQTQPSMQTISSRRGDDQNTAEPRHKSGVHPLGPKLEDIPSGYLT